MPGESPTLPSASARRSRGSVRMFERDWMEALSKIPFYVPLLIYVPLAVYLTMQALAAPAFGVARYLGYFAAGLAVWTATEYLLHRFVFHWRPPGAIGARLHFIFHGVHHDCPNDALRLVMPPSVSLPLAYLFHTLFALLLGGPALAATFTGFILGYVAYDTLHYALHHHAFAHPLFRWLKRNHMQHHFVSPDRGYGVSSPLWDYVFGTRRKTA